MGQIMRFGRPDLTVGFLGGIGDDLLCTIPVREWLDRGKRNIWFVTRQPRLHRGIDSRVRLLPEDPRLLRLALRLGEPMRALGYSDYDTLSDRDTALSEHCAVTMCRRAGLQGAVSLKPSVALTGAEIDGARKWQGHLAVQTSSMSAVVPMGTKQWPAAHMQQVVDQLSRTHRCVQIGSAGDPPLRNVVDLRGRTSIRETAAVLFHARLFIGLVGFLMHLARAMDCPSVIVYGGRETPALTGYSCNINVTRQPPCSPCWQRNRCNFEHTCMTDLSPELVLAAVDRGLSTLIRPLAIDVADL